jgi:hypothetical protein
MLKAYAATIDTALRNCVAVTTHSLQTVELSPNTGYVEGEALLIDGSRLIFFEFLRQRGPVLDREKYRYHYMDANQRLSFRYDNAPHHSEVGTFPHHKHTPSDITTSSAPTFATVLAEAEGMALGIP